MREESKCRELSENKQKSHQPTKFYKSNSGCQTNLMCYPQTLKSLCWNSNFFSTHHILSFFLNTVISTLFLTVLPLLKLCDEKKPLSFSFLMVGPNVLPYKCPAHEQTLTFLSFSICFSRTAVLSIASTSTVSSLSKRYLLTPTMTSDPEGQQHKKVLITWPYSLQDLFN